MISSSNKRSLKHSNSVSSSSSYADRSESLAKERESTNPVGVVTDVKHVFLIDQVENLFLDREKGVLIRGISVQQPLRALCLVMLYVGRRNVFRQFLQQQSCACQSGDCILKSL